MKTTAEMLREFHEAFGVQKQDMSNKLARMLPHQIIQEEMEEVTEAVLGDDMAEVLKELADLVYTCYAFCDIGDLPLDEAIQRVHASNMSKLGDDGKPVINGVNCPLDPNRPEGKILKGPNYEKPNLGDLV